MVSVVFLYKRTTFKQNLFPFAQSLKQSNQRIFITHVFATCQKQPLFLAYRPVIGATTKSEYYRALKVHGACPSL